MGPHVPPFIRTLHPALQTHGAGSDGRAAPSTGRDAAALRHELPRGAVNVPVSGSGGADPHARLLGLGAGPCPSN